MSLRDIVLQCFPDTAEDDGQQLAGIVVGHPAPLRRPGDQVMIEGQAVAGGQTRGEGVDLEPSDLSGRRGLRPRRAGLPSAGRSPFRPFG